MATTVVRDWSADALLEITPERAERMRAALYEIVQSAQGDSDKADEVEAVCWYDGQVNIAEYALMMLTGVKRCQHCPAFEDETEAFPTCRGTENGEHEFLGAPS